LERQAGSCQRGKRANVDESFSFDAKFYLYPCILISMRWNKWFTAMILSGIIVIVGLAIELIGCGEKGLAMGLLGIWLTLIFGLIGVVNSLDTSGLLENTQIFWKAIQIF
jgi:hypothetical protein